jgi:hypothetical protein
VQSFTLICRTIGNKQLSKPELTTNKQITDKQINQVILLVNLELAAKRQWTDHTFGISLQICEAGFASARQTNFGGHHDGTAARILRYSK